MKKQATLFDMVKKMKTTPLAIALELSKNESLQHEPSSSTLEPSSQESNITKMFAIPDPVTDSKRTLDTIISQDPSPRKETKVVQSQEDKTTEDPSRFNSQSNFEFNDHEEFEVIVKKVKSEPSKDVVDYKTETVAPRLEKIDNASELPTVSTVKVQNQARLRSLSHISYNPYVDAPFQDGDDVPFSIIVDCFEEVSKTHGESSKEKIIDTLCNMYRTILLLKPQQLTLAYYFCIMRICPDYQKDKELGIGGSTLVKAISKATGRTEKKIRDDMTVLGDLGKVAAVSKTSQASLQKFFVKKDEGKRLTIKTVIETFRRIAKLKGNNSNIEKERAMTKLILDAKEEEAKYIVRFVEANFRIGAAELTMQSGLVKAFLVRNHVDERTMKSKSKGWSNYIPSYEAKFKKYEEIVTQAINEYPDYDRLIEGLIRVGSDIDSLLKFCKITPGVPVNPMLAHPANGPDTIMKRFQNLKFTCEYKYDGARGQMHYKNGEYYLFSRNQIDMTESYPDVVEVFREVVSSKIESFIVDSEIVAYNPQTQKILPFQKLSMRGRKNVDQNQIEVKVCVFIFDVLYLNGESLLKLSLRERRNLLYSNFQELDNKFRFAQHRDTESIEEVKDFLADSIKQGAEGLMVKSLDNNSAYEPGIRSFSWMKLKKDYLEDGSADTYDLVPIGAYFGTGKRAGIFGGYLLACYNSDLERYETFCVCGRGITDEDLDKYTNFFKENSLPQCPPEYFVGNTGANLWLKPCVVWECKGSDIQLSPIYTAGIGEVDSNRGLGLRFPRIVRIREDKKPTDATDSSEIAELYKNQAAVMNDE